MPIWASFAGNEGAHLRQHDDQRVLAQIGRLAAHVRAGDQEDVPGIVPGEIRVVGDEGHALALECGLDHRMASALDVEGEARVDDRPHPVETHGEIGERWR